MQVELRHISHGLGPRRIFNDINIQLQSGQTLVITGQLGSGKTLLFSILCGLFQPDQGEVLFDGLTMDAMSAQARLQLRQDCRVVFEVAALLSNLSLAENLLLPLNLYYPDRPAGQKRQQVEDICHEFGLSDYLNLRTANLSIGLAALASLARALLVTPKCLIWDAPLSHIDLIWTRYIYKRLDQLKANGCTFIFFTNREQLIERYADQQFCLTHSQPLPGHSAQAISNKGNGS